ncbi:ATPase [bacterium M21]|nr:ATPase [bacterium M21]
MNKFAAIGAALAIGLSALATGFAQAKIGAAGMGAIAENPKRLGAVIMLVAIPETVAILGFVIAYLILNPA